MFDIFGKLTVCFDLVPKGLYLFVNDLAELYSAELRSISTQLDKDGSVSENQIISIKFCFSFFC